MNNGIELSIFIPTVDVDQKFQYVSWKDISVKVIYQIVVTSQMLITVIKNL